MTKTHPSAQLHVHYHPNAQYSVVVSGQAILQVESRQWAVKAGDTYYIPPNASHGVKPTSDEQLVMLEFQVPAREDLLKFSSPEEQQDE